MKIEDRCKIATDCLPQSKYRTQLEKLHADLLSMSNSANLEKALTVCRCAARVVDSPAYQGVSDEDCDLENAVRNWRAVRPDV